MGMLARLSSTHNRIALNAPSTRARSIFLPSPHTTARWRGVEDAPPSCFLKYAPTSNIVLYSTHSILHHLLLTPHTHTHISCDLPRFSDLTHGPELETVLFFSPISLTVM